MLDELLDIFCTEDNDSLRGLIEELISTDLSIEQQELIFDIVSIAYEIGNSEKE